MTNDDSKPKTRWHDDAQALQRMTSEISWLAKTRHTGHGGGSRSSQIRIGVAELEVARAQGE